MHAARAAMAAITVQDIRNVEALAARPDVLDVLARSLAPSIYGHALIKKGLVLLLLGGRRAAIRASSLRWHSSAVQLGHVVLVWVGGRRTCAAPMALVAECKPWARQGHVPATDVPATDGHWIGLLRSLRYIIGVGAARCCCT